MILHRKMTRALSIVPLEDSFSKSAFAGNIFVSKQTKTDCWGILEHPSQAIIKRYSYDESHVTKGFFMGNKSINLTSCPSAYSFSEYVVALNKKLLEHTISNSVKWAFTKLELYKPPIIGNFELRLINNLGVKLTKSAIYVDDVFYGYIYFSDFSKASQ
ncbi:hypothetical protein GCM10007966_05650 [Legionella impletisoli]|uniref:Uncharacterized protein n=2 Tax=Legionella impletisoli TaxID=343510 RepID=A0A917JPP3_9GAMM|nr:hypothetical protein GCM10007966_05650 [Legionella impletisoli]